MRVGFNPTSCTISSEPGSKVAATMNGAADEKSPGTSTRPSSSRSAGPTVTLVRPPPNPRARGGEHDLRVVAGRDRLDDGRRPPSA